MTTIEQPTDYDKADGRLCSPYNLYRPLAALEAAYPGQSWEEAIPDLIADLLHLADATAAGNDELQDGGGVLYTAERHWSVEVEGDDLVQPISQRGYTPLPE
jgi:hypothetical protein